MSKVDVKETVHIAGAFGHQRDNLLNVEISLTFDIPPATFSPGMKLIVERELQNSVTRLIEAAKKIK